MLKAVFEAGSSEETLKVDDVANAVVYMASAPKHMLIDEIVIHLLFQNYPIA